MSKRRKRPNKQPVSFAQAMATGAQLLQAGRAKEALPLLHHAYQLRPDDVDAAINLGGVYVMLNRPKLAIPILEKATQLAPENSKLWINLGAAYLGNPILANQEKQGRAIAAFEKALELDPAAPSVNYNMGLIYRDQGNLAAAIEQFQRAVTINPLDRDAARMLERLTAALSDRSSPSSAKRGKSNGS